MFITFEGLDFSGKSTQAKLLVENLRKRRIVHFLREPGGTEISERIRVILLDKKNLDMTDAAEILLFSASRAQLVAQVILPALARGESVVCDRYCDSTTAYQGYGRGLNLDDVRAINHFATQGRMPDATFLIDIPIAEIERRKTIAGLTFDRMESAGREFYERVREGYLRLAAQEPERWLVVNGMNPIHAIETQVWSALQERMENASASARVS